MDNVATKTKPDVTQAAAGFLETVKSLFKITEFVILLVVILLVIVGGIINPRFLGVANMKIMTRDTAILAIAAARFRKRLD